MRVSLLLFLTFASVTSPAQTTWYVDDDAPGDPGPGDSLVSDPLEDGSPAHPFDGIQEAIDVASAGDTVLVADGTYTGPDNRNLNFGGRDLTLISENGPDTCIIDVELTPYSRAINFVGGEGPASVVQGLTMIGGRPTYDGDEIETIGFAGGGAVYCENSSPTFIDCVIRDNQPFGSVRDENVDLGAVGLVSSGGGMCFVDSRSVLVGCVVRDNRPERAGMARRLRTGPIGMGVSARQSDLVLLDCLIEGNWRTGSGRGSDTRGGGGGIGVEGGSLVLLDCTIRENRAGDGGQGRTGLSDLNGDGGHGGGVYVRNASLEMRRCRIERNLGGRGRNAGNLSAGLGGDGGGVYLENAVADISQCVILANNGGAGGDGPAFNPREGGDGGFGGAMAVVGGQVTVDSCLLAGNTSGRAGTPDPEFTVGEGGAVSVVAGAVVTLVNLTCVDNRVAPGGFVPGLNGGLYESASSLVVANTILWNNTPRSVDPGGALTIDYSIVEGGFPGTANLAVDPQFTDPAGPDLDPNTIADNDYRPISGAPGNDSGDNAAAVGAFDLDGAARVADDLAAIDACGAVCVDRGAYEAGNGAPAGDICNEVLSDGNDCDGNGIVDRCELAGRDCDGNGLIDACEAAGGTLQDCNSNGVPDACDVDCDRNGIPDDCELAAGGADCNNNGVLDACEFGDCNGNGVLDVCELGTSGVPDCNGNQVPDSCEMLRDCNENGVPDVCELADGTATDCDNNGLIDTCEDAAVDCDANGVPDVCDLADGNATDCNNNGLIDSCENLDCDNDGVPDACEPDCDADGLPDDCELIAPRPGYALEIPGGTTRMEFAGSFGAYGLEDGEITIEAWVRPSDIQPGNVYTIVRKSPNNYWLRLIDGQIRFAYRGDDVYGYASDTVILPDVWQHIAVVHTFGTSSIQVYHNGEQVGGAWLTEPASLPGQNDTPLYIANSNNLGTGFVGLMDEIRIWQVARSQEQIQRWMTASFETLPPNLIALCPFETGSGQPVELVGDRRAALNGARWQPLVNCSACPDVNGDGFVDLSDLATVLRNFGQAGGPAAGDLSRDGRIDLTDLELVLSGFGVGC